MERLDLEFYYGQEADQFTFYRLPKALIVDARFKEISNNAKLLYGLMLDRMSLSARSGWFDEENRVFIKYAITSIMEDLNCSKMTAVGALKELHEIGLIDMIQENGKANIIYVKNFFSASRLQNSENHDSREVKITNQEISESQFKNSENHDSGQVNITNQEYPNSLPNDNNINNNKKNNTDFSETPILSYQDEDKQKPDAMRWMRERKTYETLIKDNIEYDIMVERYRKEWLDEIVEIMVDVVCSKEPYIRVNKQEYPHEVVKSRFLKIDSSHIEYIESALKDNTSNVRNIRAFLITTIYRSFETADNWYAAKVNYDLANPRKSWSDD